MTKEEKILLAAKEEFFRKGYDAASTASIAKTVGVTHAMVNYYYRTKEKLFCRILDEIIHDIIRRIKPLMDADGDYASVLTDTALAIFDEMNENRRLPFLIHDISRNHPEFLLRYKDTFNTMCMDSIRNHSVRLEEAVAKGRMQPGTMHDVFDTILTLSCTPFLNLSILTNIARIPDSSIDSYLESRREEIRRILESRYQSRPGRP